MQPWTSQFDDKLSAVDIVMGPDRLTAFRSYDTIGMFASALSTPSGSYNCYVEIVPSFPAANCNIGVCNSRVDPANYIGSDSNGLSFGSDANVRAGGNIIGTCPGFVNADTVAIAISGATQTVRFRNVTQDTAWSDPFLLYGVGMPPYRLGVTLYEQDSLAIANFYGPFTGEPPTGFLNWNPEALFSEQPVKVLDFTAVIMDGDYSSTGVDDLEVMPFSYIRWGAANLDARSSLRFTDWVMEEDNEDEDLPLLSITITAEAGPGNNYLWGKWDDGDPFLIIRFHFLGTEPNYISNVPIPAPKGVPPNRGQGHVLTLLNSCDTPTVFTWSNGRVFGTENVLVYAPIESATFPPSVAPAKPKPLVTPDVKWAAWQGNAALSPANSMQIGSNSAGSGQALGAFQPGDLYIVMAAIGSGGNSNAYLSGSSFTKIVDDQSDDTHARYMVWWKYAEPGETGVYTVSFTVPSFGVWSAWNLGQNAVIDAWEGGWHSAPTNDGLLPGCDPHSPVSRLLTHWFMFDNDTTPWVLPPELTQLFNSGQLTAGAWGASGTMKLTAPGMTPELIATNGVLQQYGGFQIAIADAVASAGTFMAPEVLLGVSMPPIGEGGGPAPTFPPVPPNTAPVPIPVGILVGPAVAPATVPPSVAGVVQPVYRTGSATAPTGAQLLPKVSTTSPHPPVVFSNVWTIPTLATGVWTTHLPAATVTTPCVAVGGWGLPGPVGGPGPPGYTNPPGAGLPHLAEAGTEDMPPAHVAAESLANEDGNGDTPRRGRRRKDT